MLEHCKSAKERWGGVNDLIDRWLKERQELIVQFCGFTTESDDQTPEDKVRKYQTFCQSLVDYVSAGHFEIYGQLITEARELDDDGGLSVANEVMPKIEKTTAAALDFNDRFDDIHKVDDGIQLFAEKFEAIGNMMEERFELEDILIETLHKAHAHSLAS